MECQLLCVNDLCYILLYYVFHNFTKSLKHVNNSLKEFSMLVFNILVRFIVNLNHFMFQQVIIIIIYTNICGVLDSLLLFPSIFVTLVAFCLSPKYGFVKVSLDSSSLSWWEIRGLYYSCGPPGWVLDVPSYCGSVSTKNWSSTTGYFQSSSQSWTIVSMYSSDNWNAVVNYWCWGSHIGWRKR